MSGALIVQGSALRDYGTGHPDEIGSETRWRDWLARLVEATAEMARVLKPSGSIFVNLGDKYSGNQSARAGSGDAHKFRPHDRVNRAHSPASRVEGVPEKSLLLLPERYRIACVDQLGLTARAVIVWSKPNGLPESVTDRVRRSHEDWVHLTLGPRYYAATDELREPHEERWAANHRPGSQNGAKIGGIVQPHRDRTDIPQEGLTGSRPMPHPLGKLPGSVWSIPSEPLQVPAYLGVDHYAAFPSEWPRRLILGWSPSGICTVCDQGRWPVVERQQVPHWKGGNLGHHTVSGVEGTWDGRPRMNTEATILGYACACTPSTLHPGTGEPSGPTYSSSIASGDGYANTGQGWGGKQGLGDRPRVGPWREYHLDRWAAPPSRPALVLDPFAGTGTTVMVARALGRHGIGVDLSAAYCRLGSWRVWHSGHATKAAGRTWRERQGTLL